MEKRNWKIYFEWIEGKNYDVLAREFELSKDTIKKICTDKVPDKIRAIHWQTMNQYKKWREYMRKQPKSTPETASVSSSSR